MEREMKVNDYMVFADDNFQIFDLVAEENCVLRQLDSRSVKVSFKTQYEDLEYRLVLITNSVNADPQINVRTVFTPLYNNMDLRVCVYNNSNFRGLTIKKGDILGSVVFGFEKGEKS